jgi:diguanylate cyclase (GGDEF)-like protein
VNSKVSVAQPADVSAPPRLLTPVALRVGLAVLLGAAAAVLLVVAVPRFGEVQTLDIVPWWTLVPLFFAAELFALAIRDRSELSALSVHDACLAFGLFVAPAAGLVGSQIAGTLLAAVAFRVHRPDRVALRVAERALATSVAIVVFAAFGSLATGSGPTSWCIATLAVLASVLAAHLLRRVAVRLGAERRTGDVSRAALVLGFGGSVASTAIALAGLALARRQDPAALLVVVPFASCALALRAYASERLRLVQFREFYTSMRVAERAPGLEAGAEELLASVLRLLRADVVWLAILPHGDVRRYTVAEWTRERQVGLTPVDLAPAELALVRSVLSQEHVVTLERGQAPREARDFVVGHGLRHALATVLHGDRGPVGVMVVGNLDDEARFGVEDVRLLETYAGHAGMLLENDRLEASVSELTTLKEQLRHQAFHDSLTGLPNRMLFTEHVARSLSLGLRTAVLFLDLDDFKAVNDTQGHSGGDALLAAFADRLRSCVRPADVPARLGGDEFAVLADGTDADEVERVAARLVDALGEPFVIGGKEILIHASVGIAFATQSSTADELVRNADVAMYDAKQAGKRRFSSYEPAMRDRVRGRNETAAALEKSVDRGEISVHYQPIVELGSGRVEAIEALARWKRTGRELLLPTSFIPLADEVGLMVEIGRSVVREACSHARSWQGLLPEHDDLTVNVNLAPTELHDPALVEAISAVLNETGLAPNRLVLEITELATTHRSEDVLAVLVGLRQLGVRIALDDYGAGNSSLSRLRQLPFDMLKITRSFVAGVAERSEDREFVAAVVSMATAMGMDVVAEGIETAAQARVAAELGCRLGQGFYFGAPVGEIGVTPYLTAPALPARPRVLQHGGIAA